MDTRTTTTMTRSEDELHVHDDFCTCAQCAAAVPWFRTSAAEEPGMTFTFWAAFAQTAIWLLEQEGLMPKGFAGCRVNGSRVTIRYTSDARYSALKAWESAAVGCGLIARSVIEH